MKNRRLGRELLVVLLHFAFAGVVGLHVTWAALRPYGRSDFSTFYLSALEARRGGDPYETRLSEPYLHLERERGEAGGAELGRATDVTNLNPPIQALLTVPLAYLPYRVAERTWYLGGIFAGIVSAFLIARLSLPGRSLRVWGPAAAIVVLLYPPTLGNALYNQVGLYVLFGVAVTFWLAARDRIIVAAAVAGLLAGLKVFAGLFGVYFLLTRRWRAFGSFTLAFAGSVLVGGLALGWGTYGGFLSALRRVSWHATSWNASVFGAATRALGSVRNNGWLLDLGAAGYGVASALAAALGLAWALLLISRGFGTERERLVLGLALTSTMMILLSPLGWLYYFPALLPGAAALLATAATRQERIVCGTAVVGFLVLSSVPQRLYLPEDLGTEGYSGFVAEMPALALVTLAGSQAWLLVRGGRERLVAGGRARTASFATDPEPGANRSASGSGARIGGWHA